MRDYADIVLTSPTSVGYVRQSPHGAAWFIGNALRNMLAQSGLARDAIDGLAITSFSLGADSAISLTQQLALSPRWIDDLAYGGASGIMALRRAARAIQAGDAEVIACIGGDGAGHGSFEQVAAEFSNFTIDAAFPYGAGGPNTAFALLTRRYMERYGARREDFGKLAVAQRYNANHYPPALLGHKTLNLEDYLQARPIAGPLHLFDCVMPCAGGEGFLVMSKDRARHLGLRYCRVLAAEELHNAHRDDPIQLRGGWTEYADRLYSTAGLDTGDIDILQTYDDYPMISFMQIEDLGFCGKGEAAAWVRDTDLRFDASGPEQRKLAHNTSGGMLSAGQAGAAAGYLGLVESIRQLTGAAGANAVSGARHALVSGFGMINYDRGLCSAAAILAGEDT